METCGFCPHYWQRPAKRSEVRDFEFRVYSQIHKDHRTLPHERSD